MSTRIKYVPAATDTNAVLVSTKDYNGYKVYLNTMDNTFEITNDTGVVATGKAKSLSQLKANAKKALTGFGIAFENETRTKPVVEVAA